MEPVYATREDVRSALDVQPSARSDRQIDRALQSGSRDVDSLCHRTFYPWQGERHFDWPDSQYRPSWRIWLDDHGLISLTSITSGGVTIDPADVVLYPPAGPPYNRVEVNLGSNASWGGGDTHQLDVSMLGLWAGCPLVEITDGTLAAAVATTVATTLTVDAATSAGVGVGSVLRIDTERLLVTGRTMADTGQTLGADLAVQKNATTLTVTDGAAFAVDETLLIGGERMRITDIAGSTLVVERAVDGSTLTAHTAGAALYAPRTLSVARAALGTIAATHADTAPVYRWEPPGLVRDLAIAETINRLGNEQAGYARARKSGDGGTSERAKNMTDLPDLRDRVYAAHGRKARHRAV